MIQIVNAKWMETVMTGSSVTVPRVVLADHVSRDRILVPTKFVMKSTIYVRNRNHVWIVMKMDMGIQQIKIALILT